MREWGRGLGSGFGGSGFDESSRSLGARESAEGKRTGKL